VSSCEPDNKLSGSIMDDKCIEYLNDHSFFKKGSAPQIIFWRICNRELGKC
jgi:hypothetical protein